jgi:diguanylate cyclase (GGDEF)-like protein
VVMDSLQKIRKYLQTESAGFQFESNAQRRATFLSIYITIGIIVFAIMAVVNVHTNQYTLVLVDVAAFASLLLLVLYQKTGGESAKIAVLFLGILLVVLLLLISYAHLSVMYLLWSILFPLVVFHIVPEKIGVLFSMLFIVGALVIYAAMSKVTPLYQIDPAVFYRIMVINVAIVLGNYFTVRTITNGYDKLEETTSHLREALRVVNRQNMQTYKRAIRDAMTGVFNRAYMEDIAPVVLLSSIRESTMIGIATLDIDLFKQYNDIYGTTAGDVALKTVAQCIESNLRRSSDKAFRYGGEEFLVLLPYTAQSTIQKTANAIHQNIKDSHITHSASPTGFLTCSIGLLLIDGSKVDDKSYEELFAMANEALLQSKKNGRNQTTFVKYPV